MILRDKSSIIVGDKACCQKGQTMDIQEILQQLATNTGTFPRQALAQALAQAMAQRTDGPSVVPDSMRRGLQAL